MFSSQNRKALKENFESRIKKIREKMSEKEELEEIECRFLLFCPYCGHETKMFRNPQTDNHSAICQNAKCGATITKKTKGAAQMAWNRRVGDLRE